ncbi:MAG: hypothetical protein LBI05_01175 [Planctomycetaceae bacterium]|jgi:hypothetical protein|nr:hypothetical protein [Planctomycetaceae bacterium]
MTAIPTKLYDAFETIRLGKVKEGTRLFDRVDGFEPIKSVALAELSYFRHDWKWGIQFVRDFFESEQDWETVRYFMMGYKHDHLKVFVLCTCLLNSWKENLSYLQQLRKKYDLSFDKPYTGKYNNHNIFQEAIALISDSENTKRALLESRPNLKTEGKIDSEHLDNLAKFVSEHLRSQRGWLRRPLTFDGVAHDAYTKARTEDHLAFYEQYADRLDDAKTHQEAALSYIALEDERGAKETICRYMRSWQFKEPWQVAPIDLFAEPKLWSIMSDQHFSESLLAIPHHRES